MFSSNNQSFCVSVMFFWSAIFITRLSTHCIQSLAYIFPYKPPRFSSSFWLKSLAHRSSSLAPPWSNGSGHALAPSLARATCPLIEPAGRVDHRNSQRMEQLVSLVEEWRYKEWWEWCNARRTCSALQFRLSSTIRCRLFLVECRACWGSSTW